MQKVVVIVNSGDNVIPRHLLDELAAAAGADTWECIDLPTESRLTKGNYIVDAHKTPLLELD